MKEFILFINSVSSEDLVAIKDYNKKTGKQYKIAVLRDISKSTWEGPANQRGVLLLTCKLNKSTSIKKTLGPYQHQIAAVIARGEVNVTNLRKIIPHVPYTPCPTETSLLWATDKLQMREQFRAYAPDITPKFTIVKDTSEESIEKIRKKVGFPLVIKPTGLAKSLLVSICFHEDELEKTLNKTLKKINKIYKENNRTDEPVILVEEFMEGEMYSIDAYINRKGSVSWCPLVHVKTGKEIGFDDFFGYQRLTPTTLNESAQEKAKLVAKDAIYALGLRNTTAHIELMRTNHGWKVIELGARIGGFRNVLYKLSYGINHSLNDILIRLNEKPKIPKKKKGYAAALVFYAKKEGKLKTFKGAKKVRALQSFEDIKINMQIGDMCKFAKHGGDSVCQVVLFNESRSNLLADIRRVEKSIIIETV